MSTTMPKAGEISRNWYILDATDKPLGRVAAKAAHILRGKHKPTFAPHVDCGDHVIIINARNETYGFPSQVQEDPVLKYVVKDDHTYDYAEERRLFYVALTRTKNRVYIITPQQHPSEFVLELIREEKQMKRYLSIYIAKDALFVAIHCNYATKKPMVFVCGFVQTNQKFVIS